MLQQQSIMIAIQIKRSQFKNTLLDAQGNAAGSTVTNEVELAAKSTKDVKQEVSVIAPKLWSTEDTNLYTMKTEIVADNKVLDT